MNSSHQSLSGLSFPCPDGRGWLMSLRVTVQAPASTLAHSHQIDLTGHQLQTKGAPQCHLFGFLGEGGCGGVEWEGRWGGLVEGIKSTPSIPLFVLFVDWQLGYFHWAVKRALSDNTLVSSVPGTCVLDVSWMKRWWFVASRVYCREGPEASTIRSICVIWQWTWD